MSTFNRYPITYEEQRASDRYIRNLDDEAFDAIFEVAPETTDEFIVELEDLLASESTGALGGGDGY